MKPWPYRLLHINLLWHRASELDARVCCWWTKHSKMRFKEAVSLLALSLMTTLVASRSSGSDDLRASLPERSVKNRERFGDFVSEQSAKIASKLRGKTLQQIFPDEILEELRTPFTGLLSWTPEYGWAPNKDDGDSDIVIRNPDFSFDDLSETSSENNDVALEILNNVTAAIREIVRTETVDITGLIEALLFTSIDGTDLQLPEVLIMVSNALAQLEAQLNPVPEYFEDRKVRESDGSPVRYHTIVHENWANVLGNTKEIKTYYPLTRTGVVNIVKKARKEKARVRASGLRHSWSHWAWGVDSVYETIEPNPCYKWGETGDVDYYIAMVPYELSNYLYFVRANVSDWQSRSQELSFVEGPLETWTDPDGTEHASVRVGASALSQFLLDWQLENGWMLPSIPGIPEFTLGGIVSTISHGAGWKFPPVSDFVIAMEYVDEKGKIQYVDDPYELDAVAGSVGLFGITLSLTLKLERTTYARLTGLAPKPELYFPRPPEPMPEELVSKIENSFFSTWYLPINHAKIAGFPGVFEYIFDDDGDAADAIPIISEAADVYNKHFEYLGSLIESIFRDELQSQGVIDYLHWITASTDRVLSGYISANSGSGGGGGSPITASVPEALSNLRAGHVFQLRNFEIDIPIRDDGNGNADWTSLAEVFWIYQDVLSGYEQYGIYPSDFTADMRVIANSTRILSPYFGNVHGTITITPSVRVGVPVEVWDQFKTDLAFRFERFDTGPGMPKARFHLGKEPPVRVTGIGETSADYFRRTFGDQIDLFKERYASIVESRGSSVERSLQRFSTKYFDQVMLECRFPRPKCLPEWPWLRDNDKH